MSLTTDTHKEMQEGTSRCPFLREAQVKSCQASAYRKMIVRTAVHTETERCLSTEFVHCPAAKQFHEDLPTQSRCPFLQESLVQYCSAAAVTKFVPYTESVLSRCGSTRHHYCELFLGMAHPAQSTTKGKDTVDGVPVPERLFFSRNHLWLDLSEDGSCHIGVDALFSRVLGKLDKITYLTSSGRVRPSAILSARGMDFQVLFPNPLDLKETNTYLRANPSRLAEDPYGRGWLFEGAEVRGAEKNGNPLTDGLLTGEEARRWMHDELERVSLFVHDRSAQPVQGGLTLMNDGGIVATGVIEHLSREDVFRLYTDFFSPYASLRR